LQKLSHNLMTIFLTCYLISADTLSLTRRPLLTSTACFESSNLIISTRSPRFHVCSAGQKTVLPYSLKSKWPSWMSSPQFNGIYLFCYFGLHTFGGSSIIKRDDSLSRFHFGSELSFLLQVLISLNCTFFELDVLITDVAIVQDSCLLLSLMLT